MTMKSKNFFISFLGLTTSIVPMYMTEIVTLDLRGPMGVLCPLGITLGVLISQILGLEFLLGNCHFSKCYVVDLTITKFQALLTDGIFYLACMEPQRFCV